MKRIAVLGAGFMGAGIAQVASRAGYEVVMRDLHMSLVNTGLQNIEKHLQRMVSRKEISSPARKAILERIRGTTDLAEVRDADMVIEAVVENMAVKQQIFAELDIICPEHCILASNTSSFSITEIASVVRRKGRVIGTHFFYPAPMIKLVEIVRAVETSQETVQKTLDFMSAMGMEAVLLNRESPGYIVNRILLTYINEAIHVLGEGLASAADIDDAMKAGTGVPLGPLEMADRIGLDTVYNGLLALLNDLRDSKYRPHHIFSIAIKAGHLGQKSGQGFYKYP